jgi:hypothetical protein
VVSDVLNGKRSISKAHARKLAGIPTAPVPYCGLPNAYINPCTRAGVPVNRSVGGWR